MKKVSIYIFFLIVAISSLCAQGDVVFVEVADGFTRPVAIRSAGDGTGRLFVVEKQGIIKLISNIATMTVESNAFLDITDRVDDAGGEEGLLGLAFHPDFETNGYFYVNYIVNAFPDSTRISRFTVDPNNPNTALASSELVLLSIAQPFNNHNGGDINFGADGYLYIASGDGGSSNDPQDHGQNQNSLLGAILRIDVDNTSSGLNYAIPASNPFGSEVWLYGLRNPWRFSFDRLTNDMYIADVGQNAREEVSVVGAGIGGLNLGWNCREGFNSFSGCTGTFHDPIFDYSHSLGVSITGGYVYRGNRFPNFNGWYFFIDFSTSRLWQTKGTSEVGLQVFTEKFNNLTISSFGESDSGELYAVSYLGGEVYRLIDQDDCPVVRNIPTVTQTENIAQELITSDAVITQDNIIYGAQEIELNPKFEVRSNLNFETLIGICGSN
jgi:glucose/arabinose dehydrogenase